MQKSLEIPGRQQQSTKIPFVDLKAQYRSIKNEIDAAIGSVIEESAFIKGHFVKEFEESFGKLFSAKHVISCGNGTDSLYIIMKMLGIGPGDEVITAANSWISSSETITQTGARPVFVDVHPAYYSLDEQQLERKITAKTKAVIAVHLQGQACDIEAIDKICQKYSIHLIEDCAQAHLASYKKTLAGKWGVASSFSFFPGKNLGAYGDAGCILTDDDELATKCRMYANHGALQKHHHLMEGINSRLDGLQAAILSAKLPYLEAWTRRRISVAAMYDRYLDGIPEIGLPVVRPDSVHTYHLYVIQTARREELQAWLDKKGIETLIHYPTPLPFLPAYQYLGYRREDFPVAAGLQPKILSLPIFPELTEEQVAFVAGSIREFFNR